MGPSGRGAVAPARSLLVRTTDRTRSGGSTTPVRALRRPGDDERSRTARLRQSAAADPMRATCAARIESATESDAALATANTVSAIERRVRGPDRSSDAVVGHHGHALAFCRGQVRVAGNDTEGRVGAGLQSSQCLEARFTGRRIAQVHSGPGGSDPPNSSSISNAQAQ